EWDGGHHGHPGVATQLLNTASELGLQQASFTLTVQVTRVHNAMGKLDHIPLTTILSFSADSGATPHRALKSDKEEQIRFVRVIKGEFAMKVDDHAPLDTPDQIDAVAQAIADSFSAAWETCSREVTITRCSKLWWTDECSITLQAYREHGLPEDWKLYCKAVKNAKRVFFDSRITEISITNKRTWDLMSWVQQRKLPPCEAIQYQGQPCHALPQLWDALHNTYNSASDCPFDIDILDSIPDMPIWGWVPFSAFEMRASCSNVLAPGLDHIKWSVLKMLMRGPTHVFTILLSLANACLWVGHWPKHFKKSMSVIIPKPNKPSYSAPKAFRPIVLLNTVGKLIEKMLSNCIQFDGVASDVFHPNQIRGICQRSTKDASLILTHMMHVGWAKGLNISVIAFDVAQFFLSLNHEVLMAILQKLGFSDNVIKFFSHYLVGRSTQYTWCDFISNLRQADVGVGQGSALSLVLSALYLTLIMRLFELDPLTRGCFLLSYVDDGTLVVQSKSLLDNCEALKRAYSVIFKLFKRFGLALEHDKSEVFHFDRSHSKDNPPVDLGYALYTGATPLKPKLYWWYLGFYFDRKLTFTEHVQYYSTKALLTVKAMKMLGSSTRGLHPVQNCSLQSVFHTSPTGGVEALAGLPLINLLLHRLSERADYRFATLTPTHPVIVFLSRFNCGTITPHPSLLIQTMSEPEIFCTSGTLFESNTNVLALTETLLPMNPLSRPGVQLMDHFVDQVHFDDCKISCSDADKELKQCTKHLDKLWDKISENIGTYYAGTDASLPLSEQYQAIAASILFSSRAELWRAWHVAGKVTMPDVELYAIRSAIFNATSSVDPSIHSGQGHSVAVCEALQTWFTQKDGQSITFVYILSRLQWDLHYKAHKYTTKLKVALGPCPATSFDSLHMQAALSCGASWNVMFQDSEYRGQNFLHLKTVDGAVAQPGGKDNPWIHFANMSSPQLYARMCWCILNHAPIGPYYS
ncbi:hypothetical protein CVT25_015211, partial [Psilocybe cyanescens]